MATRIKEKYKARQLTKDRRPTAHARHIRISPTKVRVVLDIIRGARYIDAVAILENTPKGASDVVRKLINSAAANAQQRDYALNELVIAEAFANAGPTLKRMMPRGKGSSNRIDKRTCHITVVLDGIGGVR
jgi:large subunit ribosomal protein L22